MSIERQPKLIARIVQREPFVRKMVPTLRFPVALRPSEPLSRWHDGLAQPDHLMSHLELSEWLLMRRFMCLVRDP